MEQTPPDNRWLASRTRSGDEYDAVYEQRAAAGQDVHGEADFVQRPGVRSVLDAGCGTGRVGRELARRSLEVTGVDLDPTMLATARAKAPDVDWRLDDLATVALGRTYDVIVMAGNVMIFVAPGTEAAVVANMAKHLAPAGLLIAGFQLQRGRLTLETYDAHCTAAALTLAERWSTWDRTPWSGTADYAVSVHINGVDRG